LDRSFDAAVGHHWMVVLWDWVAGAVRLAADVVGIARKKWTSTREKSHRTHRVGRNQRAGPPGGGHAQGGWCSVLEEVGGEWRAGRRRGGRVATHA